MDVVYDALLAGGVGGCGDGHRVIVQKTAQSQTEGDHYDDGQPKPY